ncbi:post-GPI attachment to proteins factor 4-like [Amphiura filiformis]|uniref:post-GPI attachment to proteins factor 4-like n=1 Tax=Amphiura filiformis TaxID=82378 RepID=UPI003B216243
MFRHYATFSLKTIIFYAIFFSCLYPFLSRYLRFSKLYQLDENKTVKNVFDINSERLTQAESYLNTINPDHTKQMYLKNGAKSDLRLAIGVVTVGRSPIRDDNPMYLTQVMSRLHQVLTESNAIGDIFLFICNVDEHPEKHTEATYLTNFFPNITRVYDAGNSLLDDAHLRRTRHSSERQDYAYCLESALHFNPKYVVLVEDDAYPHQDFYEILHTILQTKLETRIRRGGLVVEDPKDWAWLKLSIPYYMNDFHRDNFVRTQWITLTCVISGIITLTFYLYKETRSLQSTKIQRNHILSCYIVLIVSFLFFLPVVWTFGRPYYLKSRGISHYFYYLEPGTSCCTPAVLYPSDKVPGIIDFLRHADFKSIPMDWAMDEYRRELKLKQYLLTPNIFTHIGFYSSLNGLRKKKSFAYEYFND